MERAVAGVFRYELVAENGETVGQVTSEQAWDVGDLVPCSGHMFEVRSIENGTLHVRRVI